MGISAEAFIKTWKGAQGGERAQAQSFLNEFCDLLGVTRPHAGDYKYEYSLRTKTSTDFIDLYKRGAFIIEAKQTRFKTAKKNDDQTDLLGVTTEQDTTTRTGRA